MAIHTDEVIRNHLRENKGQTVTQIASALDLGPSRVRAVLKSMVDVYVCDYRPNTDGVSGRAVPIVAVYCVAEIPKDCPAP
jgi:predicted ArsR family transcriptional regulator